MEVRTPSSFGYQLYVDGVAHDVSNLIIKPNVVKVVEKLYPTDSIYILNDEIDHSSSFEHNGLSGEVFHSKQKLFEGLSCLQQDDENAKVIELLLSQLDHVQGIKDIEITNKNMMKKPPPPSSGCSIRTNQIASMRRMPDVSLMCKDNIHQKFFDETDRSSQSSGILQSNLPEIDEGKFSTLFTNYDHSCEENYSSSNKKVAPSYQDEYQYDDDSDDDTSVKMEALTIEIAPGVSECVRGSAETIEAHRSGNLVQVHCFCCDQNISCVDDAAYVLCPTCSVVSPLPEETLARHTSWGVGLGFVPKKFPKGNISS